MDIEAVGVEGVAESVLVDSEEAEGLRWRGMTTGVTGHDQVIVEIR